jgi:hypothetical protein
MGGNLSLVAELPAVRQWFCPASPKATWRQKRKSPRRAALDAPTRCVTHGRFAERLRTVMGVNRIFVSYSHRDQEFLRRLMVHLRPLEKKGLIQLWADLTLPADDNWKEEI